MQYFYDFFIRNFFLLCIAIVMIVLSIQKRREHKRVSLFIIIIMSSTVLLSILESLQDYLQYEVGNALGTTILSSVCYVLRPFCILLFIMLSGEATKKWMTYVLLVPLLVCVVIYALPFLPGCEQLVFSFEISQYTNQLEFNPGTTVLRFTAHVVSILYFVYLVYASIAILRIKHIGRAVSILICGLVVILAVIVETFFNSKGTIHLLNASIAISTVFYYLFIVAEKNQYDTLTGLYNRATYYTDVNRMERDVTAVIQIDMNALKYFNDTFGHEEGDRGLKAIADAIQANINKRMYAYRMGGDEFLVLVTHESEETVIKSTEGIMNTLKTTKYRCSIGYCYGGYGDSRIALYDMAKTAESNMYLEKAKFYETSKIERRRIIKPNTNQE